jgi:hypothetical protein
MQLLPRSFLPFLPLPVVVAAVNDNTKTKTILAGRKHREYNKPSHANKNNNYNNNNSNYHLGKENAADYYEETIIIIIIISDSCYYCR